jgi:hypothetical protein
VHAHRLPCSSVSARGSVALSMKMALWPFRRKSGRKRPRSGAALSDAEGPPARSQTEGVVAREGSIKKQRTEPSRLQRRARTYSFSPGRQDRLESDRPRVSTDRAGPGTRRGDRDDAPHDSLWDRTPTLHHGQSKRKATRGKSTKRKKDDQMRAAEVKAMSNFTPVRPATDSWTAGRPMKKESKRVKTLGFGDQPASHVSLPVPGSIHSSMSSDSEYGPYKVSALDSLAPRPTLRYAQGSRWTSSHVSALPQQRKTLSERSIPEETLKNHKRIDDLADDLDSSDLRELMEREDRRREKKRQREQDRAARRLARRAEKQKAEEGEARKQGTPPPENLERGVAGRELVGLGIDPASVTVTSSKRRDSEASESIPDADVRNDEITGDQLAVKKAPESLPGTDPLPAEDARIVGEHSHEVKPQVSNSSIGQYSRLTGLLRSKKSRSKSTLASDTERMMSPPPEKIDEEGELRKGSVSSEKRGRFSLSSFLRWSSKPRRLSGGPSSFSNTSREEMQAAAIAAASNTSMHSAHTPAQAQALALAKLQGEDISLPTESNTGTYLSRKLSSSAPTRTKSRFREDLPELPISPPDSRMQSPEADAYLPALDEKPKYENGTQPMAIPTPHHDSSMYSHQQRTSSPADQVSSITSPDPHQSVSMSLASIDSEGSWLSGRVAARRSSALKDSINQTSRVNENRASNSPHNSTQEDLSITEDEYLARLAHRRNSGFYHSRRSGDGRPSSDEEGVDDDESGARWGAVGARRANIVRTHKHDRTTMQSHDGLVNIVSEDEAEPDTDGSSPITPSIQEKAELQRARSVNLSRHHVRNFSAGSAKLLDITPRSSVDSKGRTLEKRSSSHLP